MFREPKSNLMMKKSVFCLLLLILNNWSYSQEDQYFLRMIKEDQIEKKLMSSSTFKDCADKKKDALGIADCINEKLNKLEKGKAEQLLKSLDLGKTELYGDPNQKNLSKYLSDLVKKSLYGDNINDPQVKSSIDQEMFGSVYERIVGKGLFLELSQYCLTRDQGSLDLDNINNQFKISSIVQKLGPSNTESFVVACIASIKQSCEFEDATKKTVKDASGCLFKRRLVEYKSILAKIKEDKKFWQDAKNESKDYLKLEFLDQKIGKSSLEISNELSNISSSKIVDIGYQEKDKKLSKQAQDMQTLCINNLSEENCKKYFNRGTKESLGELRLQKELELQLKIKQLEDSDLSKLKEVAKNSSYFSDAELKKYMESTDPEALKNAIKEKYDEELIAIKKDIDDRIDKIGISKEENLAQATRQLTNIQKILADKPEEIRAVNFFSNIIVATFKFKNDPDGKKRVFSSIDQEIKDLKNQTNNPDTQTAIDYLNSFKQGRTAASAEENHFLDPDEIDDILFGKNP